MVKSVVLVGLTLVIVLVPPWTNIVTYSTPSSPRTVICMRFNAPSSLVSAQQLIDKAKEYTRRRL